MQLHFSHEDLRDTFKIQKKPCNTSYTIAHCYIHVYKEAFLVYVCLVNQYTNFGFVINLVSLFKIKNSLM